MPCAELSEPRWRDAPQRSEEAAARKVAGRPWCRQAPRDVVAWRPLGRNGARKRNVHRGGGQALGLTPRPHRCMRRTLLLLLLRCRVCPWAAAHKTAPLQGTPVQSRNTLVVACALRSGSEMLRKMSCTNSDVSLLWEWEHSRGGGETSRLGGRVPCEDFQWPVGARSPRAS